MQIVLTTVFFKLLSYSGFNSHLSRNSSCIAEGVDPEANSFHARRADCHENNQGVAQCHECGVGWQFAPPVCSATPGGLNCLPLGKTVR